MLFNERDEFTALELEAGLDEGLLSSRLHIVVYMVNPYGSKQMTATNDRPPSSTNRPAAARRHAHADLHGRDGATERRIEHAYL